MQDFTPFSALAGGALVGLAAAILLLFHGRIAGVSGIAAGLFAKPTEASGFRLAFLAGLVATGALLARLAPGAFDAGPARSPLLVAGAGLLVGFGSRLGGGCTSGHGVCGIARLSFRSLVATVTFMAVAAAVVFASRHLAGGGS